jgi:hypothetical protein
MKHVVLETKTGNAYANDLKPFLKGLVAAGFQVDFNPESLSVYGQTGPTSLIFYGGAQEYLRPQCKGSSKRQANTSS